MVQGPNWWDETEPPPIGIPVAPIPTRSELVQRAIDALTLARSGGQQRPLAPYDAILDQVQVRLRALQRLDPMPGAEADALRWHLDGFDWQELEPVEREYVKRCDAALALIAGACR